MDKNEVLKLIDAGFSADEIREMLAPSAEPEAEQPAGEHHEDPAPQAEQTTQAEQQPANIPDSAAALMSGLKDTLDSMQATLLSIQQANMRRTPADLPKEPLDVAADVLAEVLMPPKRDTKGEKK